MRYRKGDYLQGIILDAYCHLITNLERNINENSK